MNHTVRQRAISCCYVCIYFCSVNVETTEQFFLFFFFLNPSFCSIPGRMNWRAKTACIKTSSECSRLTASKTSISFLRLLCFPLSTRNSAVRRLSVDPVFMICSQSSYMLHFSFLSESPLVSPASISDCFARDKGPWIIKPVASSRGRGIYLVSNVSDFFFFFFAHRSFSCFPPFWLGCPHTGNTSSQVMSSV